jgi:UDP-N-acetylmuramoylalanine--D-glutamate ligase
MKFDWKDKKVAVLGLGVEGIANLEYLHKNGVSAWVVDKRQKEELDHDLLTQAEALGAKFILGENYLENISQFDIIFRSPGIRRNTKELLEAELKGTVISSQTKLFFDLCPCPIIGVTGTKGKGTTSSLIYEMLKEAGKDAYLGGNIGVPPLTFLEKLQTSSIVVLELSSFQLQDLGQSPADAKTMAGKPHIAVMLMVTSEHLDHHATQEEYVDAKRNIFRSQTPSDFAIVNRDYPASNESDIYTEAKLYYVSRERETDNACFVVGNKIILRKNGQDTEIIKTSEVLLPGRHNLENVCAAIIAASLAGVGTTHIANVLKSFKGLEHRLELIDEVNGVRYYDDSFSTTPETAIAAIQAFTVPEIVILGGSTKHSNFSELGKVLASAKNVKAIIGIGEEWERIKSSLKTAELGLGKETILVEGATTMQQIVLAAATIAKPGDVVLLSPACASFDMFKNYKERGEQFKKEVKLLSVN